MIQTTLSGTTLDTHMPLVSKIPGLQRAESGRFVAALDGSEQTYYRVAELYFADQKALAAAFGTDEGKATSADYQQIAPPGSRMFVEVLDGTADGAGRNRQEQDVAGRP